MFVESEPSNVFIPAEAVLISFNRTSGAGVVGGGVVVGGLVVDEVVVVTGLLEVGGGEAVSLPPQDEAMMAINARPAKIERILDLIISDLHNLSPDNNDTP
ncbi:hypothetical protein JP09_004345 [Dehalogenimonas etheniformans]|uniref:Uncharacterized protein n=1 Tax=Dehalogenimonas etheniformans TaxID=1536648 RepID=A0A2P5P7T1_9CHLR|nr:hypothetical protein JP09_004345 [Dehalogenimonas etheniformans]